MKGEQTVILFIRAAIQLRSEADIRITRDLIRAGQLLKIEVLDHIVWESQSHQSSKSWLFSVAGDNAE